MERNEVRREIERIFGRGNLDELYKLIRSADSLFIADILWNYMEEADNGSKAKKELNELKEKIKALNNKSGQRTRCVKLLKDRRALIQLGMLKEEVMISPNVDISKLFPGTEVLIIGQGDGRILAEIRESSLTDGIVSKVKRKIGEDRIIVENGGNELILKIANGIHCNENDEIRYDLESRMVLEIIKSKTDSFTLENIPNVTFDNVKGLEKEKEYIKQKIIYPLVYKEKFERYGLKAVNGVILHGPPGTGKTFLASAIFNEMAKLKNNKTQNKGFFVVNGPDTLNKWVGTTESTIRSIFEEARNAAKQSGFTSIIFWDEIESIAGKRRNTDTYTPEKTIVPTLLAEIQGINESNNVVLIGATNRADLIDPALMRPGRLGDAIIELPRPNKNAAMQILEQSLNRKNIPEILIKLINNNLKEKIISHIYDNKKPLAYGKIKPNEFEPLMRYQLANGALFSQIGDEMVRNSCMFEINNENEPTIDDIIKSIDKILLTQIGVLDAEVKCGFRKDISNYVIDVSLDG